MSEFIPRRDSPLAGLLEARAENLLFMFDRVCRETHIARAAASGAGPDHMSLINFLPRVICGPEFCLRTTVGAIGGTGLHPEQIVFAGLDTEAITDHEHLRSILCQYRRNDSLDAAGRLYRLRGTVSVAHDRAAPTE